MDIFKPSKCFWCGEVKARPSVTTWIHFHLRTTRIACECGISGPWSIEADIETSVKDAWKQWEKFKRRFDDGSETEKRTA